MGADRKNESIHLKKGRRLTSPERFFIVDLYPSDRGERRQCGHDRSRCRCGKRLHPPGRIKMTIVYPVNERLMLRKARDSRIMRLSAALAARGHKVILLVGRSGASRKEILDYYGIEELARLEIVQLPILRKRGFFGFSWNGIFHLFVLIKLIAICRREPVQVVYLSVMKLAAFLLRWRRWIPADHFVYELHALGIYPEIAGPDNRALQTDR